GYQAAEAIGRHISVLLPGDCLSQPELDDFSEPHTRIGASEAVRLRKDGSLVDVALTVSPIRDSSGAISGASVIARNITERKRAEKRLHDQANMLDHARDAILLRSLDDDVLFWNKSAERIYGYSSEEVIGTDVRRLMHRERIAEYEEAKKALLTNGEWSGELKQNTKSGKVIVAESRWTLIRDDAGNPRSVLSITTDITDKKRLEAQFLRAQRLESIGTLAGGIAHDLNNILSPVLMATQFLQLRFPDHEEAQRLLSIIRTNIERGGDMVAQVLSFARGVEGERIVIQPSHLIKEIAKILKDTLPKSIDVRVKLPASLWSVSGDATQLYQVLMNLGVNARDAMGSGGTLLIEADNTTIDEGYARMHLGAEPGNYVIFKVVDTGTGIPADIVDKVFDPFFTTKEPGKGTGLGLSTALAIVKSHGGFINVYSEPGRGTQFVFHIPAAEAGKNMGVSQDFPDLPRGHGETILIIDDEASIREVTSSTLIAFGYEALTANDGTEGVAIYAKHKERISAVLTDMMMPYMDGAATIRALQKLDPGVRIIASSGLAGNVRVAEAATNAGVRIFLPKPYTADRLLRALADVLAMQKL
ncbi:MAG: hybrid sensor histidine kinase/response regulator, partial [Blastocatellia bacterium]